MSEKKLQGKKENLDSVPLDQRAVIYARYSTRNQREESIEHQIDLCEAYAKEKGWVVVKKYWDKAETATQTVSRTAYNRMIDDSESEQFSKVIVFKIDRFSRNLRDYLNDQYRLALNGVEIHSTREQFQQGPMGKLAEVMVVLAAELYADSVSEHTTKAIYRNAAQGWYTGGKIPLGYKTVTEDGRKALAIDEQEAQSVRFIFEQYAAGKTYSDLVELLDERNIRTKNGDRFSIGSFNSLFNNPIYVGQFIFGKDTDHPQKSDRPDLRIISEELFESVQEKLKQNKTHGSKFRGKRAYILSGFVKCAKCESNMTVTTSSKKKDSGTVYDYCYYTCPARREKDQNGNKLCDMANISVDSLEQYVMDRIIRKLFGFASLEDVTARLNQYIKAQAKESTLEIKEQKKLLRKNQKRLERLKTQIGDGSKDPSLEEEMERATEICQRLEDKIRELEIQQESELCTPKEVVSLIRFMRKQEFLKLKAPEIDRFMDAYLDKVLVYDDKIRVKLNINSVYDEDDS